MAFQHVLLALFWILYGILHSLLASRRVKEGFQKKWPRAFDYYRVAYTLFAFVSLAALLWFQLTMRTVFLLAPNSFLWATGVFFAAAGLLLMLVCIRKYFFSLSGLKSLITEEKEAKLIISGVHRWVRHPLYLGTFSFIWGLFLITPQLSLLIADTLITAYTLIGIRLEEEKLEFVFGEGYSRYKKEVPALVPRPPKS